ncbi:MAG TPA: YcxB family protein [Stenotrophomonas sp.]
MQDAVAVEVEFTPVLGDFLRATWAIVRVSPLLWLMHFTPVLIGIVLLVVLATSSLPNPAWYWVLGVVLVLMVPAMLAGNLWRVLGQCKRLCPMRYRFDSDGIGVANQLESMHQQWPMIRRVRVDQGVLLLYFARDKAHCIPLRVLAPGAEQTVMAMARAAGVR